MHQYLGYQYQEPAIEIQNYVDGFWCLNYTGKAEREVILLPDGKIDLFLSKSDKEPFHISLMGVATMPERAILSPGMQLFAISFHPLATEYILQRSVAKLLNSGEMLKSGFWGFSSADLKDFEGFCHKATLIIKRLVPKLPDFRRIRMQELLLESKGETTIKRMEKYCFLSSRHLNRYWTEDLGLSLKTYLQILQFRKAIGQLKKGKLYPNANYADQSHFIKAVKRLSGHLPKDLLNNKDGRFIQFSVSRTP